MASIVVVGSINADLMLQVDRHPKPGETLIGSGGSIAPGGKGANQAVAAAVQGSNVSMVGAVGDDAYADQALALLRRAGVCLDAVATVEGPTGLAVVSVDKQGENAIIVVPGANASVDQKLVSMHEALIAGADVVVLQGEIPASGFVAAARAATGRLVVNLAPVIEVPKQELLRADPLIANEHEAGLILEQLGADASGEPEELAGKLVDAGFASVIITLGSKGCLVAEGDKVETVPAQACEVVDTTGAGDAFTGALAAHLEEGLLAAATHASKFAARTVTKAGAQASYF